MHAKLASHSGTGGVAANSVVNRGVTYNPPVLDGKPNPAVLLIAEHAIIFFDNLFAEIDAKGGY